MNGYHSFIYYSPLDDKNVMRVFMFDTHGREFFATIEFGEGREFRDRRARAALAVADAIESGREPGEVPLQ